MYSKLPPRERSAQIDLIPISISPLEFPPKHFHFEGFTQLTPLILFSTRFPDYYTASAPWAAAVAAQILTFQGSRRRPLVHSPSGIAHSAVGVGGTEREGVVGLPPRALLLLAGHGTLACCRQSSPPTVACRLARSVRLLHNATFYVPLMAPPFSLPPSRR